MSVESSTDEATELWLQWLRAHQALRAVILSDVTGQSGIAEQDLTVLIHLSKAGGELRQNALASTISWDRTRLSHLLTRMEGRGLITRTKLTNGVQVTLTALGRDTLEQAMPHLSDAARRHLLDRLGRQDAAALRRILKALCVPR
ncbi:MarR family winged helix-turn-helix transcriptional regulator [Streptomyces sp. IB201691-2A2]|uniref:MarR family winged helix-turn-helix transcriptional regulator n=1 Tax=Streptomyces sp. IB201691-2A2 TaxID=2561920 RepID=UPI00117C23BB|nr:MarR family winged helix-turn-helix transcriptional regulator [Streptomyces sp. IB201691-2A2]TRO56704.1 MarR family transcriptional regulator [Streptomyces sp. IB201691-2A2]